MFIVGRFLIFYYFKGICCRCFSDPYLYCSLDVPDILNTKCCDYFWSLLDTHLTFCGIRILLTYSVSTDKKDSIKYFTDLYFYGY